MRKTQRRWIAFAISVAVLVVPVGWAAYAAMTWLRFGHTERRATNDVVMERYIPRYDIAEVHRIRVAAPPAAVYAAAMALDLKRSPVVSGIFRSRELMLRARPDPRPSLPITRELVAIGWGPLEDVPGHHITFGAVTQPWKPNVTFRALKPRDFARFDSAGFVKIVVTFAVDSIGPRDAVFRTETRAVATDADSHSRFRRYWSVFSPGILIIRREALRMVKRDAERTMLDDD